MRQNSELEERAEKRLREDDYRKVANYCNRKADSTEDIQEKIELIQIKNEYLDKLEEVEDKSHDWNDLTQSQQAKKDLERYMEENDLEEFVGEFDEPYEDLIISALEENPSRKPEGIMASVYRDQEWISPEEAANKFNTSENTVSKNNRRIGVIYDERTDYLKQNLSSLNARFSVFDEFDEKYDGIIEDYVEDTPGAIPGDMGAHLEIELTKDFHGRTEDDVIQYFGTSQKGLERAREYSDQWLRNHNRPDEDELIKEIIEDS
jgi:hypothetical protein